MNECLHPKDRRVFYDGLEFCDVCHELITADVQNTACQLRRLVEEVNSLLLQNESMLKSLEEPGGSRIKDEFANVLEMVKLRESCIQYNASRPIVDLLNDNQVKIPTLVRQEAFNLVSASMEIKKTLKEETSHG